MDTITKIFGESYFPKVKGEDDTLSSCCNAQISEHGICHDCKEPSTSNEQDLEDYKIKQEIKYANK